MSRRLNDCPLHPLHPLHQQAKIACFHGQSCDCSKPKLGSVEKVLPPRPPANIQTTNQPANRPSLPCPAKMSEPSSQGDQHSRETLPEQNSTPPRQSTRTDSAPVVFKDSFGPVGKDGQQASIVVSNYAHDFRRPSEPLRRQSLIRFNTAPAEDTIRRESLATGRMPSAEARKMSAGEKKPCEGGRRMSSPPPKRYVKNALDL